MNYSDFSLWQYFKGHFNMKQDQLDEAAIVAGITSGITFKGSNLWILIFAIFIASLGLNVNSTAVIIGAMLISPLMGPILGIGLAVGINDLGLLKRSGKNLMLETVISITTATIYFTLTPYQGVQSELLARTSPTIYDVLIALFGGAAGIIAICSKDRGNVLPGVAIATALMPPLCTAGYGIANGNLSFFAGAFFLYFINTVFITLATFVGVRLMKFHQKEFADPQRKKFVLRIITSIVILTMIPAALMTYKITKESIFSRQLGIFTNENLSWKGTQIVSQNIVNDSILRIVAVGKPISDRQIDVAQNAISNFKQLNGIKLEVIQGVDPDSISTLKAEMGEQGTTAQEMALIQNQAEQIKKLNNSLTKYKELEHTSISIKPEIKTLYPAVQALSLTPIIEVQTDTSSNKEYALAMVKLRAGNRLNENDSKRMKEWLKARIKTDSLIIIIR